MILPYLVWGLLKNSEIYIMDNTTAAEIAASIPELQLQTSGIDIETFRKRLSLTINQLIQTDFTKLVGILYRLDISEAKLKAALADAVHTASDIIATMIIERQIEKSESRKRFRHNGDISEEERW